MSFLATWTWIKDEGLMIHCLLSVKNRLFTISSFLPSFFILPSEQKIFFFSPFNKKNMFNYVTMAQYNISSYQLPVARIEIPVAQNAATLSAVSSSLMLPNYGEAHAYNGLAHGLKQPLGMQYLPVQWAYGQNGDTSTCAMYQDAVSCSTPGAAL
jgi:hypothetical protein